MQDGLMILLRKLSVPSLASLLVYSEKHASIRRVQYFKGKTLDELKACTAGDAGIWPDSHEGYLDSRGFYAGKTATDGTDRYMWGWCPNRPGNNNTDVGAAPAEPSWGGNLVAHKVMQNADGTLVLVPVNAIAECPQHDLLYSEDSFFFRQVRNLSRQGHRF